MTRREAWITALAIFAVALVVRAATSAATAFPRPEDSAYYVGVARNLVEGRGLVSDAIWSYGTPPLVFPRPAFEVWLPLPSLLAAIPMALMTSARPIPLDMALRAAQVLSCLLGAVLAVLAWRLGADVAAERHLPIGRFRMVALGAGLTTAVYLPLVLHAAAPDSTTLFGVLAVGGCLLATRILRNPRGASVRDPRLIGLGLLLGAAALTRNEALWMALAWAWLALRLPETRRALRIRLVAIVACVSIALFAPWALRDWLVFGNPLPGQALANALSVTGFDIFAWQDPPTLARYLAVGPLRLGEMRVDGIGHNLLSVLLALGLPLSIVGLAALPWQSRDRALRPLLLLSVTTFAVTSLLFPVATTWGTFLHAAAPVHVLLIVAAVCGLDSGFARLAGRMGWTKQVAWLGAVAAVGASILFPSALLPASARQASSAARTYAVLGRELADLGIPTGTGDGVAPLITNFPIWTAEALRTRTLALPDESPASVVNLAQRFGAHWLVLSGDTHGHWPQILATGVPGAACFAPTPLPTPADPADAAAIEGVRLYRIGCPATTTTPQDTPDANHRRARLATGSLWRLHSPHMDEPRSEPSGSAFDELHAAAAETLTLAANSLRSVRERYRQVYLEDLGRWQALGDEVSMLEHVVAAPADDDDGRGSETFDAATADIRLRALRQGVHQARTDLSLHEAELSRIELALRNIESTWLFLERGDATLISEPAIPSVQTEFQMRILEAQEAERSRLAQEVHDGPAQALSNAIFSVEFIDRIFESDPRMARSELRILRGLLRRELGDVRSFVSQLRPPVLVELGLNGSLQDAVETVSALSGLVIETDLQGPSDALAETAQTAVLRIMQEALQNVRKHAGAVNVWVATRRDGDIWTLEVRDDGRGFDTGTVAVRGRRNFGLQFMRERAQLIGARLEVESQPEAGTVVRLAIPLPHKESG